MYSAAARYAKALFQLAIEKNVLEQVHTDIRFFANVCTSNTSLVSTLKSPMIRHAKKLAVLQGIFQRKVHALTFNFFTMVTKKHREDLLPTMVQAFLAQYDHHHGIQKAQVTTPFPLSKQLSLQLKKIVQRRSSCQKVILKQNIDPSLLGGYILQIEDQRIDQSLRKKLRTLHKNCMIEGL
mmetsp:Transcript_22513/g.51920  ORF Transcript_22513/g.51920 Transcript_22513/m.51920 type:complete len:181 (-) Transcript_22513:4650-5192(-)